MEVLGYIGALIMGLSLGLIGGGGSILTVPILVYLFSIDTVLATAYSLFIVGLTSLIGSLSHISQGNIHWKTAFIFGIPSIITVYLSRLYLVPIIPNELMTFGDFLVTKSLFMLLLFALLMIFASYTMIQEYKHFKDVEEGKIKYNYPLILIEGIGVGIITGLVGAGGGFLIIPALVVLAKLPMKKAIGTSLIIIALKSLIGFIGDLKGPSLMDWQFLGYFSIVAIIGILIGSRFSKQMPDEKLKPAFGYFVMVMGILIIAKELIFQ
ncbi:MAG: sulfite exporter TauE/SafE family protein [Bacteroidota bacterium]